MSSNCCNYKTVQLVLDTFLFFGNSRFFTERGKNKCYLMKKGAVTLLFCWPTRAQPYLSQQLIFNTLTNALRQCTLNVVIILISNYRKIQFRSIAQQRQQIYFLMVNFSGFYLIISATFFSSNPMYLQNSPMVMSWCFSLEQDAFILFNKLREYRSLLPVIIIMSFG